MLVETSWIINGMSGSMDKDHYFVPAPNRPGMSIMKHKPRHKPGWKKSEGQERTNNNHKTALERASAEYNDPVKRAEWQARYDAWKKEQERHGGVRPGDPIIRHLWDFVRWQVMLETAN